MSGGLPAPAGASPSAPLLARGISSEGRHTSASCNRLSYRRREGRVSGGGVPLSLVVSPGPLKAALGCRAGGSWIYGGGNSNKHSLGGKGVPRKQDSCLGPRVGGRHGLAGQ